MFEKAGKGRIQARDLGELLRCLGWNPSEQDLEEARHELEVTARGTITFADVEAYVARRGGIYYGNNAEEDILVAFQVLDRPHARYAAAPHVTSNCWTAQVTVTALSSMEMHIFRKPRLGLKQEALPLAWGLP
ncbi:hypothetical protein BaRGS_00030111 [Batillaria attramentaria]|uniref:Uncharacterized protein n=1 Tax=Batillaria attramentaria TaxID=370345 RepID=A0ABD0JVR1_9CAEN